MKTAESVRQDFFNFFRSKGHTIVPSASLAPENDPTLLFTNAGMNQFKDIFLGTGTRPYTRAADTQKVMRVSGKHNDFDDVGRDTYHHTFFEMLGNWSFGDYYKKEAIMWAWELLTDIWKLPKERLYATVHYSDKESFEIWRNFTDINPEHILEFGDKENFWEMGATGPCGPCSEIHIDLSPDPAQSIGVQGINTDNPLFIELWNLVFIQFNRNEDGSLTELPAKHVDTGMGLERITAVLQQKNSNYDTDLFMPIINAVSEHSGIIYTQGPEGTPHRVIADHIRALTLAVGDGIMPSNEGRGYVIRKILRRAARFGRELGLTEPFLHFLVPVVVKIMSEPFPELRDKLDSITSVIKSEEESFFRTLNKGFEKIKELIAKTHASQSQTVSGEDIFLLYDSMGFPIDFTEQILKDENLTYDKPAFEKLMDLQKERARASWKADSLDFSSFRHLPDTQYIETHAVEAAILKSTEQNDDTIALVLDKTPFYAEKGGQVGDIGTITADGLIVDIFDTKFLDGKHIHLGKIKQGRVSEGQTVTAEVDKTRKKNIARHHSAAHLINKALRQVLGSHVSQAGSWIGDTRMRFDFTHPKALTSDELRQIETIVNQDILDNYTADIKEMPIENAKKLGAVAAFEEKYGDIVRVVGLGDSLELCGGTHVKSTGEIGTISIIGETSVSSGTRRIEAIAGKAALDRFQETVEREKELSGLLKVPEKKLTERVETLLNELKEKEKEIKFYKNLLINAKFDELLNQSIFVKDYTILITEINADNETLTALSLKFKEKVKSGVMVLAAKQGDKALLSAAVSEDLNSRLHAGQLIKELAPMIGGGGGGKADFALAGGKNAAGLCLALAAAQEKISNLL